MIDPEMHRRKHAEVQGVYNAYLSQIKPCRDELENAFVAAGVKPTDQKWLLGIVDRLGKIIAYANVYGGIKQQIEQDLREIASAPKREPDLMRGEFDCTKTYLSTDSASDKLARTANEIINLAALRGMGK